METISDNGKLNDLIVIGRFAAPFGVRGWLNVVAFGARTDSFTQNRKWQCAPDSDELSLGSWQWYDIEDIRTLRGDGLAVKLHGIDTREQAAMWRGGGIALPRHCLPPPPQEEYYWCDLIGLSAINEEGITLGQVAGLMRTGAHDILRIVPTEVNLRNESESKQLTNTKMQEMLVPFIDHYVLEVDLAGGVVRLHWQPDW